MKKFLSLILASVLCFSISFAFGCQKSSSNLSSYDIEVAYKDGQIDGVMTLDYFNDTDNALDQLKFNLYLNAFREGAKYSPIAAQYSARGYYDGINYGYMEILSVKSLEENLSFSIKGEDENILVVDLKETLYPEERVSVSITYKAKLAKVISRSGINQSAINLANFYPILCGYDQNGFYECIYYSNGDPYYSDCADYNVKLILDKNYTVAASGKLVKEWTEEGKTIKEYTLSCARSFALCFSENFESVTDTSTGVEIIYYFYDDSMPNKAIDSAVKSIKLFTEKFGEYPYPTYSIVQTKFLQGGMEFPALVMISDSLEEAAYVEVIVHETAHQWWQTTVGNNEIEYGFLDEGLAEYSVVIFYENYPEYNFTREKLIESSEKTYKMYCTVYDKLFGEVDTKMIKNLGEFKGEYEYVNLAYVKPCIMYEYLRKTVGDKNFFQSLKRYYNEYKFKNANPDSLMGAFEKCGNDTNSFFTSFFEGKVII